MEVEDQFKMPGLITPRKPKGTTVPPVQKPTEEENETPIVPDANSEIGGQPPRGQASTTSEPDVFKDKSESKRIPPLAPEKRVPTPAEKKARYAAMLSQLKYKAPPRAAPFDTGYGLEVLKNGLVIDRISFNPEKSFYVIGRSPGCDITCEHLTFSRMHAILQFIGENKKIADVQPQEKDVTETEDVPQVDVESGNMGLGKCKEKGLYLFDLNSTHGSFLNKNQLYPMRYYRLRVGHVMKFGNSTRLFVVVGPPEDEEEESDKTVTELLKERLEKEFERKREMEKLGTTMDGRPRVENVEEDGISWGMAEDAVEETDLSVNPFAADFESSDANFDNPKKTLLGWFEREGYHDELVYDVREKTNGHFICRINLPLDGPGGAPIFAEVDGKGKKKDIVAQCALKACQVLDKYGVLRQSHQVSLKRKMKDWEDKDYYSSDEDTYLDRTGSVEKKRNIRMTKAGKIEAKTETYESLCEKHASIQTEIDVLNRKLARAESDKLKEDAAEVDPLDAFMQHLKTGATDIRKMKSKQKELNEELKKSKKLMDIAAPLAIVPPKTAKVQKTSGRSISETFDISPPKISSTSTVVKEDEEIDSDIPDPPTKKIRSDRPIPKDGAHAKVEKTEDRTSTSEDITVENVIPKTTVEEIESGDIDDLSFVPQGKTGESTDETEVSKSKRKRNRNRHQVKKPDAARTVYDSSKPEYSEWVPPTDQRGDGWTKLNEKLGY